jgi:hypothetical protein
MDAGRQCRLDEKRNRVAVGSRHRAYRTWLFIVTLRYVRGCTSVPERAGFDYLVTFVPPPFDNSSTQICLVYLVWAKHLRRRLITFFMSHASMR